MKTVHQPVAASKVVPAPKQPSESDDDSGSDEMVSEEADLVGLEDIDDDIGEQRNK